MKVVLLIIVSCIYATAFPQKLNNVNDEDHEITIIDGNNAKRNQFPYMVSIQKNGRHICGAVIITESWLVTGANCFPRGLVPVPVTVVPTNPVPLPIYNAVAGSLILGESRTDTQISRIEQVIYHPNNAWLRPENDIALVKLAYPLRFTESVKPVQLPKSSTKSSGKAVVAGWGLIDFNSWTSASALQYLEVDLISNKECNKILADIPVPGAYPFLIKRDRMCALPENAGGSVCYRDNGGPLVQNNTLVGIVHGTAVWKCNQLLKNKQYPSIFTRVSSAIDFINLYVEL